MLRLPRFRYYSARTIEEAVRILSDYGPEAMPVAGGTDVYPKMKRRQFEPKVLVGLRQVRDLAEIKGDGSRGMSIGAGATLAMIVQNKNLAASYPALVRAGQVIAHPQIRNMGTLGGNLCLDTRCTYYDQTLFWREALGFCLKKDGSVCPVAPGGDRCWAVSSTDGAPAVIALDAQIRLVGPQGERVISAGELYRDDGRQFLAKRPDEIIVEVLLPPADGWKSTYLKLRRRGAFDFPVLGVAVAIQEDGGVCRQARIVVGGVGSAPIRCRPAEAVLVGDRIDADRIEEAAHRVYQIIKPLDNTDFVHLYRKKMAPVFTRRALQELMATT
ncbi:MAG TPA: FAD binding domain-containing protein [Blastocatellia bacterium]|nr:FAD binding domain-containing protein [Blastocatellia bacterium]